MSAAGLLQNDLIPILGETDLVLKVPAGVQDVFAHPAVLGVVQILNGFARVPAPHHGDAVLVLDHLAQAPAASQTYCVTRLVASSGETPELEAAYL